MRLGRKYISSLARGGVLDFSFLSAQDLEREKTSRVVVQWGIRGPPSIVTNSEGMKDMGLERWQDHPLRIVPESGARKA